MLLMFAWRTPDCSIPNDDDWICRSCRLHGNKWRKIKAAVLAFWKEKDGRLYQQRLTKERGYLEENSKKNRSAARKRWDDFHAKALNNKETLDAYAMPNACERNAPTPTPTPTPKKKEPPIPPKLFESFWDNFPRQRRGSRDKAFTAYQIALTRTTEEKLHAAVIRYSASSDVQRGFAKGAAAWLNDDRWDDEPSQPASQSTDARNASPKPTNYERAILAGIRG